MKKVVLIVLLLILVLPLQAQTKDDLKAQAKTLSTQLLVLVAQHPCPKPVNRKDDKVMLDWQSCTRKINMEYRNTYEEKVKELVTQMKAAGVNTTELDDKIGIQHTNSSVTYVAQQLSKLSN